MAETIYDLCIIGAGMYGSAAARHASANVGVKVCLVGPDEPTTEEKISRQIFGAHYDEGRIISILDDDVCTQMLTKLSVSRFRELEELSGIQFYHPVGCLHVNLKNSPCSMHVLHIANITEFPVVDLSYNDIFKRRFPFLQLKSDDQPLLEDTGSGYISPRSIVAAHKKVALLQGCHIVKDVVNEVTPFKDNIHEVKTEKGKVLKSKRILICTGVFTNLKKFPIPKLKIDIFKESVAFIKIPVEEAERLSSMPVMIYYRPEIELGAYILPPIQYHDGNFYLKIGHMGFEVKSDKLHTLEEVRDWYLSKGDTERIKELSELLISMLPGLKYDEVIGLTCASCENPSGLPFIDRVSPTVTVAVVGNSRGAKISEEVGRIAAHLSLTGKWDSQLGHNIFRIVVDEE